MTGPDEPIGASGLAREPLDQLARGLWSVVLLATALAGLGLAVPGSVGDGIATAAVALVLAAPLLRVLWLVVAWWHTGDRRFVVIGSALLLVVALGGALALAI